MLQFILATAAAFCLGKHMSYSDVERPEPTWLGRSASPRRRDAAAPLADRALCGIDMPLNLRIQIAPVCTTAMRIVSIPLACAAMSGLASIIFRCAPVHAHDWYPLECCSRKDCMPAKGIEGDGRGGMTVIVEDLRIGIPEGLAPRPSRDSRIHVCIGTFANEIDGSIIVTPICLFLPAQV